MKLPLAVQVAGVATMAAGFGLLAVWAGMAVGGLGLVLLGVAAELENGGDRDGAG